MTLEVHNRTSGQDGHRVPLNTPWSKNENGVYLKHHLLHTTRRLESLDRAQEHLQNHIHSTYITRKPEPGPAKTGSRCWRMSSTYSKDRCLFVSSNGKFKDVCHVVNPLKEHNEERLRYYLLTQSIMYRGARQLVVLQIT
jgi:hypothetical protein